MSTAIVVKVLAAILAAAAVGEAVTSEIIQPIRESGDEVAIIFIPGTFIDGAVYRDTAEAIQAASPLRVWAALTENWTMGVPNTLEMDGAVQGAITDLHTAGMKADIFIGVGHSLGGILLQDYARDSPLNATVLMGAYIPRDENLWEYPKPLLTLSGELDGQARITRIAVEYAKLLEDFKNDTSAIYRTPVINIKGSCHGQFASGPMPEVVEIYDIEPDVTDEEAHAMIGQHVGSFLSTWFSSEPTVVDKGKQGLKDAFSDSGVRFQPLLTVKAYDLDANGLSSPWALFSQGLFAGDYINKTEVYDKVESEVEFILSKPTLTKVGSGIVINITALIDAVWNPYDMSTLMESPHEVDIKMKSSDAIREAFNAGVSKAGETANLTCRSLNEEAMEVGLSMSTPEAKDRYLQRGRPLILYDDIIYGTGLEWSVEGIQMKEDDDGLHVTSVALYTDTDSWIYPGMQYCKVLSPYRAMEWMNVDSLRAHAVPI